MASNRPLKEKGTTRRHGGWSGVNEGDKYAKWEGNALFSAPTKERLLKELNDYFETDKYTRQNYNKPDTRKVTTRTRDNNGEWYETTSRKTKDGKDISTRRKLTTGKLSRK